MSYYSSDFIDNLRLKSDLVSLISEDATLKGRGDRLMGLCPFPDHAEKTPSFSVSASQGLYHCFGCKKSGNIFTYLQEQRAMDFKTAVEYLANRAGLELPKTTFTPRRAASHASYFDLSSKINSFFQNNLKKTQTDSVIRKYLKKRAWSGETIQTFGLGYADSKKSLTTFLNTKEQKIAFELGLLNRSHQDGSLFDTFRNRLIFPILSVNKKVIGFGARVLDSSLPKYINSRDSKIFHKGHIFYGLHESARHLRQKSSVLLVEGYTDFLSLWESGFKNTVATLGTALTPEHAQLLKKYVDTVILVFDGDQAGLTASTRSLPLLLKESLNVKFLSLPENQDPDDFIKEKGAKAFQEKIDAAQDLFLFQLSEKQKQFHDPVPLIDEMSPLLAQVKNKVQQDIYKQRLLDFFGRDASMLAPFLDEKIKQARKDLRTPSKTSTNTVSEPPSLFSLSKLIQEERLLLVLCLQSEKLLERFLNDKGLLFLKTEEAGKIFKFLEEIFVDDEKKEQEKKQVFARLIHLMIERVSDVSQLFHSSYPVFKLLNNMTREENYEKVFQDCMNSLKNRKKHLEASSLVADIKIKGGEDLQALEKMYQLTKQRLNRRS